MFSILYFDWRPPWYDTTFQLWMSLKDLRDTSISPDDAIAWLESW